MIGAFSAAVFRFLDGTVHLAALTAVDPIADEAGRADFPRPVEDFPPFRQAQNGEPFAIPDTELTPHEGIRHVARVHGFRSMLYVPLMNGGRPGMFGIGTGSGTPGCSSHDMMPVAATCSSCRNSS